MNRKKELLEAFFLIILFLFIIAQLVLPETGIGGVLNEGSMAILFFGIGIFCICSIVKKKKKEKSALILGIGLSIFAFYIWLSHLRTSYKRFNGRTAYDPFNISYGKRN